MSKSMIRQNSNSERIVRWQDWLPVITGVFYFFSALSVLAVYLHSKRTGHKVEKYEPKMVEFNTVMSELIFLRSR